MTGPRQEAQHQDLGAYALGGLADAERAEVDEHVAGCDTCRAELAELAGIAARLDEVPPEFFLDGPPEGGGLLVQRAVGRVRAERRGSVTRRRLLTAAAAVVVGIALAGAGVLTGRETAPTPVASAPAPVPGTRSVEATDPTTGARLAVDVIPAAGWVRLSAEVEGVPAGERCRIVVVGAGGQREVAGSWLVSAKGAREGTALDGFALVAPADVSAVVVETVTGRRFVSAPVR